jgi:hypothetical protein
MSFGGKPGTTVATKRRKYAPDGGNQPRKRSANWTAQDPSAADANDVIKLRREAVDTPQMASRRRSKLVRPPKFFLMRGPDWRSAVAVRFGLPIVGAVAALTFAWLVTQL